ncbi:hypothetical protein VCPCS022_001910B, partial [Vibrio cholerae O1 str. PCS-022]
NHRIRCYLSQILERVQRAHSSLHLPVTSA